MNLRDFQNCRDRCIRPPGSPATINQLRVILTETITGFIIMINKILLQLILAATSMALWVEGLMYRAIDRLDVWAEPLFKIQDAESDL